MVISALKKALPLLSQGLSFPRKRERKTKGSRRIAGGVEMDELIMLHGAEPRKILQTVIEKKVPAVMSYLSGGKWHATKALLTNLGADRFDIEALPTEKPYPMSIQVNQPVGMSLKYGYGNFIFETKVVGLEPSSEPQSGGTIVLAVPDRIELVQRRSYFRVDVPAALKVNVAMWHRCGTDGENRIPAEHCWQGRLIDISAGGAQIVVDAVQKPDFRTGQFIGLRFTPMPYETPLVFNAKIRSVLPTTDDKSICFGVQVVGLEASPEGRGVLQRLCSIVERYHQMNQSGVKQQDLQTTNS